MQSALQSCKVFPFPRQAQSYRRNGKKVKASEKKMKNRRDLYEEEKRRHEETLKRYQEDHMDEMEIVNLHKRCNKKASQPKKAPKPFKSDEPKKAPKSAEFIGDLS